MTPHLLSIQSTSFASRFWSGLRAWIETGVSQDLSASDRRKRYIVNSAPVILAMVVGFYNVIFALTGNAVLIWTGLIQWPVVALGLFWFRFCQLRRIDVSYWAVAGLVSTDVLVGIFSGQGTLINTHVYFLLFSLLVGLTVPLNRWPHAVLISLVYFGLFLWLDVAGIPAAPEIRQLPDEVLGMLAGSVYAAMVGALFCTIFVSEAFTAILEERLRLLADTDVMTELPNRRAFQRLLQQSVARAQRSPVALSVAVIDIDKFKQVNDTYGHATGDDVIRHVALTLQEYARQSDFVARIGGEEFVILMQGIPADGALRVAERIRSAVDCHPCISAMTRIKVSVSIGIAQWQAPMGERSLFEAADQALLEAKHGGRNRVCVMDGGSSFAPC